jgi:hypothetical protein
MAAKSKSARKKYVIIARSTETIKERYACVNAGGVVIKRIPFETPVYLTDKEVAALKNQRESIQVDAPINVYQLMEKHKISQEKANRLAQKIEEDKSMGGKKIEWVAKYIVSPT